MAPPQPDVLHTFSLADVPREHRRSFPQGLAAIDGDRRLTWPELDDRVNRLAQALIAEGVDPGDVILWLAQNSHGILECLLAAAKIGAVCCVANWRQSADEFAFVIEDAAAKVVVWQEAEVGEAVRAARGRLATADVDTRWLQLDTDTTGAVDAESLDAESLDAYDAFVASGEPIDPSRDVDPAAPVLMLYTAAFLGTPNGALLSHDAVLVQSMLMANLQRIDQRYVYLNSGPLFHVATFMTTLATMLMGGTNVFTPRVDAEELLRIISEERCTGAFLMGPTMDQILELNAANADGDRPYDLSSLRTFKGRREWNEMVTIDDSPWGTRPAGFGQTELMGMLTLNAFGGDGTGNSGRPSPMVSVRLLDPDGNEVPDGETGEICARGPQVMVGYHRRDEENQRRQRDGWHHTNDLGRREPDGTISFVAPLGRLIKSAAENIYPAEVEAALQTHDAVREAAVIGIPDPTWGQSVRAIVVLNDGALAGEDELIDHVKTRIASYKKPKSVVFRTEPLPRNGWPIDYETLDASYGGGGYPGGG